MTFSPSFRPYNSTDRETCLAIFDANCPSFFAPNERADYISFLDATPEDYEVCEVDRGIVAAFGLTPGDANDNRLVWIMLDPGSQGAGIGSVIMQRIISQSRDSGSWMIRIAASQKSAPFFAKFGAKVTAHTKDGWGPGMDRVDMEIVL